MNISQIRKEYAQKRLTLAECDSSPLIQFELWLKEAILADVDEPTAMCLSTVSTDGRPSSRTVLLKGLENGRFIFYTNYQSRKGVQMERAPGVSLSFFWPEIERQVLVEGIAEKITTQESDEYFHSRPYESRIGAWASRQSRTACSRVEIERRFKEFSARYPEFVPRPPYWGGYAVSADRAEFWQGRPGRLHDRILYTLKEGGWCRMRLYP
ncbi:MAG: pyridoxamine 5'-phosphate oxidase [Spirochaetota bacterium]